MCEYLYFDNDKWLIFVKNAYLCTTKQGCKVFTRDKCSAAFVRLPMAANIQLVFYRNPKNPKADMLVKALLKRKKLRCHYLPPRNHIIIGGTTLKSSILKD